MPLYLEHLQQRDARWVVPDLTGKGGRVRTVTVPAGVKTRVDLWTVAAGISSGPLFRPDPAAAPPCVGPDDRTLPEEEQNLVEAVNDGLGLELG